MDPFSVASRDDGEHQGMSHQRGAVGRILGMMSSPHITAYQPNHGGAGVAKEEAKTEAPGSLLLGM